MNTNIYTDLSREDTTPSNIITNTVDSNGRNATILSAYFGLDNNIGINGNTVNASDGNGLDGMPLVFSHELDWETVQPGDFHVETTMDDNNNDDETTTTIIIPRVSTFRPATDTGELRTVLLLGQFGSNPTKVCIVGNIWDKCHQINFKDIPCITPKPLIGVPELVFAEEITDVQQDANTTASSSSSWCPSNASDHIIRVTWDAGITLENGISIPPHEYANKYTVTLKDGSIVVPTTLADLNNDGDNNHLLCFNKNDSGSWNTTTDNTNNGNNNINNNPPINVAIVGGFFTDPNEDGLNLPTNVTVATSQSGCPIDINNIPTMQPTTTTALPSSSSSVFDSSSSTTYPTTVYPVYPTTTTTSSSPQPTIYSLSTDSFDDDDTNINSGSFVVVERFSCCVWMYLLSVILILIFKY